MDMHGNYEGGGVCDECQHNTEGINCETCVFGYFRAEGVLPNATDPCQRKHHWKSISLQVGFSVFTVWKLLKIRNFSNFAKKKKKKKK